MTMEDANDDGRSAPSRRLEPTEARLGRSGPPSLGTLSSPPPTRRCYLWTTMQPLKAHVRKGRLVLDEPTDLPEGEVVELIPLDEVLSTDGDDLDDEERAALHRSIDESIEDEQAGNVEDLSKIIAELRAQL